MESTATEIERRFAALDPQTVAYLELVSGKMGPRALRAWLRYTGFSLNGQQHLTAEQRVERARKNAMRYVSALTATI